MFKSLIMGVALIFASCAHSYTPPKERLITDTRDNQVYPAPGYRWVHQDDPKNLEVKWVPGVPYSERQSYLYASRKEGKWSLQTGYVLEDPSKIESPEDIRVRWVPGLPTGYPNVITSEERGLFRPALGYAWIRPEVKGDFSVRWVPNAFIEIDENIITSSHEGMFVPRQGYHWADGGVEERPDPGRQARSRIAKKYTILQNLELGHAGDLVQVFSVVQSFTSDLGRALEQVNRDMHSVKNVEVNSGRGTDHGGSSPSLGGGGGPAGGGGGHDRSGAGANPNERSSPGTIGPGDRSTDRPSRERPI